MFAHTVILLILTANVKGSGVLDQCHTRWFEQRLDHFRWWRGDDAPPPTWRQRYMVCDGAWKGPGQPIFFYAGNEGPVEGYVKSGGLMWQNAERFGALLLWAEHRYYGESQPFGPDSWKRDPTFLTSRQAMADYANLITNLTHTWGAQNSPVIAFGGSYGGMLAAWMRRAYPHLIAGAVAASAPVGQFPGVAGFQPLRFWEIVTKSATPEAGSPADCAANVHYALALLLRLGGSEDGRVRLQRSFRLCNELKTEEDATDLAYWVQGAFDAFAMGAYPFASSYMGGTDDHPLPPWPMRAACSHITADSEWLSAHRRRTSIGAGKDSSLHSAGLLLRGPFRRHATPNRKNGFGHAVREGANRNEDELREHDEEWLLSSLQEAAAVLYNATQDQACFDLALEGPAAGNAGPWDWQVCTEFMGQELPYFPATGRSDMFWDQGRFDLDAIRDHCRAAWGVEPTVDTHVTMDGGLDYRGVTNIVFSNGLLDPWSAFGMLERTKGMDDSIVIVLIEDGGHHVDLMFDHPEDSEAIREARQQILQQIQRWVDEAATRGPGTTTAAS